MTTDPKKTRDAPDRLPPETGYVHRQGHGHHYGHSEQRTHERMTREYAGDEVRQAIEAIERDPSNVSPTHAKIFRDEVLRLMDVRWAARVKLLEEKIGKLRAIIAGAP